MLIGLGRMAQGGHFATDVIWAGGIVYLSGITLYYLLGLYKYPPDMQPVNLVCRT
jgi:membrane-associated PAP2 superfamily phosphatase